VLVLVVVVEVEVELLGVPELPPSLAAMAAPTTAAATTPPITSGLTAKSPAPAPAAPPAAGAADAVVTGPISAANWPAIAWELALIGWMAAVERAAAPAAPKRVTDEPAGTTTLLPPVVT
jgi:hypothetical protein